MSAPEREQLSRYVELKAKQKKLEQQARAAASEASTLAEKFKSWMDRNSKLSCKRLGFQLSLVDGRPSVKWKDEFIKVKGSEAAANIQKKAPVPKRLTVEPVS